MNALDERLQERVERDRDHECKGFGTDLVCVSIVAAAKLPSRFGDFRIVAFWNNRGQKDHIAIIHGDVIGAKVASRLPHLLPPNPHNHFYLETKAARSGHYIDFSGIPHLQEQSAPVIVDGMGE
jgi:hypothetical protein